jgi:O-antigen/teichoic acid export membrane protein
LFSAFVVLNHNEKDPHTLYLNVLEAAFLLVLPAGVGISLIADPMVHLMLGERWLSAIPVVQILAIVSTISMFGTLSDAMNAAAGNLRGNFVMYSISAALRVPLLLVLVSAYGVTGGAIALGLSTLADQVLFVGVTLRRLDIHAKELVTRLWRAILACLAMTACLWSVGWAWTSTTGDSIFSVSVDMLLRAGAGALTYTAAIVILWIAAGRPNGAERYVFDHIQKLIGRLTGSAAAR